ncbi:receptor-type tyrosine-protein kinase FLT3 [Scomber japonicus]|uniref:receptor-type tyrosine-protein kinase FLT3 n=1 Tax=Scomber japonicus TaxID=13676 RepID=UPI002305A7BF|nr:receptor-type tyrosine-protein kinase FLT3 [Scomber japonicus]
MRRQRNMIAAGVYSDGRAAQSQDCVPTVEVACFLPAEYLNASRLVSVEVRAGKKLSISLKGLYEYSDCQWIRGTDAVKAMSFSDSIILPPLSGTDSGEYTLSCEAGNGTRFSLSVALHVVMTRPTKPQLILTDTENDKKSPLFKCKSTGSPKPTLKWFKNVDGTNFGGNIETAESTITSVDYINRGVMCCATNPEGQECSQLYDLDINTMGNKVSNVTLTPGQSLLLRCRQHRKPFTYSSLMWEKGTTSIDPKTSGCLSKNKEEICIEKDGHSTSQMAYLLIESVSVNHTGIYTCRNQVNKTKSVNISVQAKDFLSVKLDDRRIVQASNSCLQANVSYQPILQRCTWEDPDKIRTKCTREEWVTMHRNVTLCNHLKSGEYKLHLEAGGQKETKTVSVCVIDKPKFNFKTVDNNFTIETWSHVPANYSWMSCSTNVSCETDFDWKEVNGTAQTDSEVSCNKTIKSSVSRQKVDGEDQIKFCITTLVGSECKIFPVYKWPSPQQSIGSSPPVNDNSTVLRTVCFGLLSALIGVSMVLTYFVKKKKPQYQPQLQMLQMVGPNDNDYIYINFKDFEYDSKWEFPRENLELGKALGSGAFGMVVQATAYGINKPGVSQQVAVKMLKDKHQTVEKEALMSELKMLTHIGHHANIVNLLGACTDTGPIYLIFQYCCHGDLLNYLKNNSKRYHKSVTDAFNKDRFRSLYHNLQPRKISSEKQTTVDNYVPMYSSTTRGQEDIALLTINSNMDSFEDPAIFENLDDQTEDLEALTFDDLLSFAYQVAKGMDFLCGKNCIHRDLAARNVLVTKGRMVKIGDFGLARDIDNDSNYVVRGNVRLPVKWMAPESIFQGMYTMKSDVWAYGILLWEIFSLGVTPYPDMKVDHVFYSMIEKGFKMECPYYANQSVYEIMCKCWALDACQRPSFSKIVSFMSGMLTDREEKLYHNMLNDYSCDYQNASFTLDISALTKQNENKTQSVNVYCKAHATEESKVEVCDSDTVEAEEEFLKTSGTE